MLWWKIYIAVYCKQVTLLTVDSKFLAYYKQFTVNCKQVIVLTVDSVNRLQ